MLGRRLPLVLLLSACVQRSEPREVLEGAGPSPDQGCPEGMRRVAGDGSVRSFCIDLREVTTAEYVACVEAGGCMTPIVDLAKCDIHRWRSERGEHPINCVPLAEARAYCHWLGRRLPTDAEWSWAAHGGVRRTKFPWGDAPDARRSCSGRLDGTCKADLSNCGADVCDLVGNVAEWVDDGDGGHLRGGSWRDPHDLDLDSWRSEDVSPASGLRCAVDVTDPAAEPLEDLALPPAPPTVPTRSLDHLDVVAEAPERGRWTEIGDGAFIPFTPGDPDAFGLPPALDTAALPAALRRCLPLRGLRSTIVFHCHRGRPGSRLVSADRGEWQIRWQIPYHGNAWFGSHTVVVDADGDEVIGYSLVSGRALWRRSREGRPRAAFDDPGLYLLEGGIVERELIALNATTGEEVWRKGEHCGIITGDGLLLADPRGIYRVEPRTGVVLARLGPPGETCSTTHRRYFPSVLRAGRLYEIITSSREVDGTLRVSELLTGRVLWRHPHVSDFVLDDDAVYVYVFDGNQDLRALSPETGETLVTLTLGYPPREIVRYASGGAFAPLLVLSGKERTMTLGRIERQVTREEYVVRGRFVQSGLPAEVRLDGALHLGPYEIDPDPSGEFVVHGHRSVGTRLEVDSQYFKVAASGVTLDGRGTYDLGEISVRPRERPGP